MPGDLGEIDVDKEIKPTEAKEVHELRKKAGVPEVDPDSPPSTYATKMTSCATKHVKKLADMIQLFEKIPESDATPVQKRSLACTNLVKLLHLF